MAPWLENFLLFSVDTCYAMLPQKSPTQQQLANCRLVSHRGERDGVTRFENTFAAFDPILENKIWAIEFDIRWTRDRVPVVIHDVDGLRVFSKNFNVNQNSWAQCQQALPLVPSLQALIARYGKKCHLMIELKEEDYPEPEKQKAILRELLSTLEPEVDFHIIALKPELFRHVDFLPKRALLPVSTTNAKTLSELALKENYGGFTGHYLFITRSLIEQHRQQTQKLGSGFANSRNVLFREINRNMDWIFSNHALAMHNILQKHLRP